MPVVSNDRIREARLKAAEEYRRAAPDILDVDGAAKYLGVTPRVLTENLEKLKIPHREIGRTLIFSREALIEWVRGANGLDARFWER